MNISMEMSHHGFELKYERKRVHFSPNEFFFIISIYTWCMRERERESERERERRRERERDVLPYAMSFQDSICRDGVFGNVSQ